MKSVDPIRDRGKIAQLKRRLRERRPRDHLLFLFGLHSGARISSYLALTISDFRDRGGVLRNPISIVDQKTGRRKDVWMNEELEDAINLRLKELTDESDDYPIFSSQKGRNPISRTQAYRLIVRWCDEVGLVGQFGTETLRKTWAYWTWRRTKSLLLIQLEFGHTSPMESARFIGLSDAEIRLSLEKAGSDKHQIDLSLCSDKAAEAIRLIAKIDEARNLGEPACLPSGPSTHSPYREVMKLVFEMYNRSVDWAENRRYLGETEGSKCSCGEAADTAHHISYENWANGAAEVQDLEQKCSRCHNTLHSSKNAPFVPFWARRHVEKLSTTHEYLRKLAGEQRFG